MCVLGLALLGCKDKASVNQAPINDVTITGKVTYTRIPETRNDQGVPTGLESDPAKFVESPARWMMVRLHTAVEETDLTGKKVWVWQAPQVGFTDTTGAYAFSIPPGTYGFVELVGANGRATSTTGSGIAASMRLIAGDAAGKGIESDIPADDRPIYVLRKPFDDSSTPSNPTVPASSITANSTVNFAVGVSDPWLISTWPSRTPETAKFESIGTGSRVLAILDTAFKVAFAYQDAGAGTSMLLLHYAPGISHAKGSFMEYAPLAYPLAYSPGSRITFGTIRGGSDNDDAWDEGVLLPLFCRNRIWQQLPTKLYPVQAHRPDEPGFLTDVQNLSPDLALLQGVPEAMAASLMAGPFLADHAAGTVRTVRDVRDWRNLGSGPYSAPALSAATWDLILKANSLPNPGTPADWAKIDAVIMDRFFTLKPLLEADETTPKDVNNFYTQIPRLQETKSALETVDLAAIFTDTTLNTILTPYGMSWPRPTSGPTATFLMDWGKDPLSFTQTITFSMAQAAQDRLGQFPNSSPLEVLYAKMLLSKDVAWGISVSPAPPAGSTLELTISNKEPISFSPTQTGPVRVTLAGNSTNAIYIPYRLRLVSPTVQQADYTFTLRFTKLSSLVSE